MTAISVLIPTYNRAKLLQRCIDSVIQSDFQDFEIIAADNCSPDETPSVLASFTDNRLRYWRNDVDKGSPRNLIDLIQAAKGEYILYLTDDDVLHKDALSRLMDYVTKDNSIGAITGSLNYIDENAKFMYVHSYHSGDCTFEEGSSALLGLTFTGHILSRIFLRREWVDIAGAERHIDSMYPQIYMLGSVLRSHKALYLHDPYVDHTVGNKIFWEYTLDYMVGARVALYSDLLSDDKWKKERNILIQNEVKRIPLHFLDTWRQSKGAWVRQQKTFLKIPQIAGSPLYWFYVVKFIGGRIVKRD